MERKVDFLHKFEGLKDEEYWQEDDFWLGRGRLKVSVNHTAKASRKMGVFIKLRIVGKRAGQVPKNRDVT